jgi:hypothetical protein
LRAKNGTNKRGGGRKMFNHSGSFSDSLSFPLKIQGAGHQWLTPVILATQQAEIKRITDQNQPGQIVCKILSQKSPSQKRASGVAQGVGPEFKSQYRKKKFFFQGL